MDIEWDPRKAISDRQKHGISFADIEPAFYDPYAISMPDPFSNDEERFLLVGSDALGRILTVSYTYRNKSVRIISARRANGAEKSDYEKGIRL